MTYCHVARVLFHCRITPHFTTGVSPAEVLMDKQIRSQSIQALRIKYIEVKQETQKMYHGRHAKACAFNEGYPVFVWNTGHGSAWLSVTITKIRGPVLYTVNLNDGCIIRKHVDHIRFRAVTVNEPTDDMCDDFLPRCPFTINGD